MANGSLATHFVKSCNISGLLYWDLRYSVQKKAVSGVVQPCLFQASDIDNFGKKLKNLGCS